MGRILLSLLVLLAARSACAQITDSVNSLIESSCFGCHDGTTETRLDFEALDDDLTDPRTFRQWEKIFDRVQRGEMPPKSEPRPDAKLLLAAVTSLHASLRETNLAAQKKNGRVPTRRLTRVEYEHSLHDLLGIRGELAKHLPPENASSNFDTVSTTQGISPLHIGAYLAAADIALDEAIQLGPQPPKQSFELKYRTNRYSTMWLERPLRRGGNTVKLVDDAWVTFDFRPHVAQSNHMGYRPPYPGMYRITAEAYGYQAKTPVTMLLYRSSEKQGGATLIAAMDLAPGKSRTVDVISYFTPDDFFYPAPADHDWQSDHQNVYGSPNGAKDYKGEGLAVKWLRIEGPLQEQWPPESTRRVLHGVEFEQLSPDTKSKRIGRRPSNDFKVQLSKEPLWHIAEIVENLAPLVFRRPLREGELESFVHLAKPGLAQDVRFEQVARIPLRAMLSSPQFLFHSSDPGPLNDYALATRLSYFLWKSLPDEDLFYLARDGKLSSPDVLSQQVDRMLADEKSDRFVEDFLDQWLGLEHIDATTPDEKLYPEYDDVLRQAMLGETRQFFRELITQNLGTQNLIDSEFTFLNRRLAVHYGIELSPETPWPEGSASSEVGHGVSGNDPTEQLRRVFLPRDSVRGGLLTHASILKVTANGTVTSPVKRGNFVLSKLLGTPPSPPPPDIGSVEPDTRGTTTIRETLDAHRNVDACANCHQHIDPPGFALECFDPIGGYRTRYRSTGQGDRSDRKLFGRRVFEYKEGLPVDASGVTADGYSFDGIDGFKQHLMQSKDQVARHFISQLVVYATGGEIQFADREEIERIVEQTSVDNYPIRTIIHEVIQSRLFRNK